MFTDLKAEESIPTFYKGSCPDPIIYRQVACSSTVAIYNGPFGDLDERGGILLTYSAMPSSLMDLLRLVSGSDISEPKRVS